MMKTKNWIAAMLIALFAGLAFASNGKGSEDWNGGGNSDHEDNSNGHSQAVPEIDGALSIQMLALLGGVIYLIKRKK